MKKKISPKAPSTKRAPSKKRAATRVSKRHAMKRVKQV